MASTYNVPGQLTSVSTPEGVIHYEYDQLGRHTRTYTGVEQTTGIPAASDGIAITDTSYSYNALGRLAAVTVSERFDTPLSTPETTDYLYDLIGNLAQVRLPNGVIADYRYDDLNRLELLRHYQDRAGGETATYQQNVDTLLAEYAYDLLPDGRRSGVTETHWVDANGDEKADASEVFETTIDWFYDSIGRMTREIHDTDDDSLDYATDYLFDLVGNRLAKQSDRDPSGTMLIDGQQIPELEAYRDGYDLNPDKTISYAYDDNDRLLTETKGVAARLDDRLTVYNYDATQQISKTVHRPTDADDLELTPADPVVAATGYGYNLQGRMSSAEIDSDGNGDLEERIEHEYNDQGIRVAKTVTTDSDADGELSDETPEATLYLVDDNNPTSYAQVLEEMAWEHSAGQLIRAYTLGLDIISQSSSGDQSPASSLFLLYDGHGSTRALLNSSGLIIPGQLYAYDAYGNAISFDPAAALTTLLYSGEHFDQRIAMQYLRARYYNPATGTFNRLDPFFGNLQDPQSLHRYLYVHGDPVQGVDPSGLASPVNLTRGDAAHQIITAYYMLEHPGQLVEGDTKPWRGRPTLRPDITNFKQKTMAEIKSVNPAEIGKGTIKLRASLDAANAAVSFGSGSWKADPWTPLVLRAFWLGAVDPIHSNWFGYIVGNVSGVITYELFQRSHPTPAPVTVPLPEIETETAKKLLEYTGARAYEDILITALLSQAMGWLLVGASAVFGGMALVTAVEGMRGGPQLYRGMPLQRGFGRFAMGV